MSRIPKVPDETPEMSISDQRLYNKIVNKVDKDSAVCSAPRPENDSLILKEENRDVRASAVQIAKSPHSSTQEDIEEHEPKFIDGKKLVWPNGICRTLATINNLKIQSYMPTPSIISNATGTTIYVEANCTLSLICTNSNGRSFQDRTYRVNTRNYLAVCRFFHHIYDWFTDDKWEGLFYIEKGSGQLVFNMEYQHVAEILRPVNQFSNGFLRAIPAVYNSERFGYKREGCLLYLNQSENQIMLDDYDVEAVIQILDSFSFQHETVLLMSCFNRPDLWGRQIKDM